MTSAKTTTKAAAKITLSEPTAIPFDKLVLSQANVRRIANGQSIEDLAEDIAHRGLMQNLNVRPILDEAGQETGRYEVPAGGRRFRALEHLVKTRRMAKGVKVPCLVRAPDSAISAEEDSLAENAHREALHPLDQFRAFKTLADAGMPTADIAARFFVSEKIVGQRLRLAAISPVLLDAYGAGEMTLECLMAFSVTEDAERQVRVWEALSKRGSLSNWGIRQALTDRTVSVGDARARYVGEEAYVAAGGTVLRDLFAERGDGWFEDEALLNRLAEAKLAEFSARVAAEGWKWIEVSLSLMTGRTYGLRNLPTRSELSEAEQEAFEAALEEREQLDSDYGYSDEEWPAEAADRMAALEDEIAAFEARAEIYDPADIAIGGAFVTLDYQGQPTVRRGYVRPQDEPAEEPGADETGVAGAAGPEAARDPAAPSVGGGEGVASAPAVMRTIITIGGSSTAAGPVAEPEEADRPLSEQHRSELTSYRTIALREALADDPEAAFIAVVHAMVIRVIVNGYRTGTCLEVSTTSSRVDHTVQGLGAYRPATALDAKREAWAKRLPADHGAIWDFLVGLDPEQRTELFALCAGLSVNAMHTPHDRRPEALPHADRLAQLVGLDMTRDWTPTAANYFSRVTKGKILAAVREAKGEDTARLLDSLRKGDMAREAERLMAESGWLPELLRTPGLNADAVGEDRPALPEADAAVGEEIEAGAVDALPEFLAGDDGIGSDPEDRAYAIAAE
ncbi:ParB/RepB/Spo0J family partition protein [Methylobacterium sp. J-043]|uniref:ParB/RepB/Spo0J family partition protein n=1 Tax=Methylorubrum TaxID=2282523 RepID=UPI00209D97CD|nr:MULTISPECIES: ParB/RepB/Spo0J family partition protein [Methylorubrum]MCJ2029465.1 ParB/RepB/Spo0J family partition protein [Methylobacterium sp. J-043]MCP1551426.1 ParB family chromosome partitioning protein [Methylorubrum zatmanii]MCP1556576.1 ParB family chromosome partitioning protein [Methylorubrum extorquens]MCP1581763.1 ParB family chromosome partitioning protein [Methylorubrum extorquens]